MEQSKIIDTLETYHTPPLGRANHPRGLLGCFLTSTPSLLDCVCSKKIATEGFIPFDIPFLRNAEIGKKQQFGLGLRLVG